MALSVDAKGSPDLFRWARDALNPEVHRVFEESSANYGWGDSCSIEFQGAPEARGDVGPKTEEDWIRAELMRSMKVHMFKTKGPESP
ncbi:MAG: hypothetical protein ACI9P7_001012 [Candidatus Azotimanducaceae bacterium]|jgi:hypothetical protein